MKNKVLSLVLALLMTASSASAVLADDAIVDETPADVVAISEDVEEVGTYKKAIDFLVAHGIYKGYDDGKLHAEADVNRYQMALFVSRIATGWVNDDTWAKDPENKSIFTDIEGAAADFNGAISYANQMKIIEGYGDGTFGPYDGITYQNALTMVVRTLGYTGLDWPWAYIQKAVELGLTENITGVAYTDDLTRGEVAQIIYNALFATTKDGKMLAVKNFGVELGWTKVVITATDVNTFTKLDKDASTKVPAGYVEFRALNADGTLGDTPYMAPAKEFGLDTAKHEDDLAVGAAYEVLFEIDTKTGYANVADYDSLYLDTIKNEGKTDDNGDDQAYAIKDFVANYALTKKYTTDNYLNGTVSGKNELLVWDKVGGITENVIDGHAIAIDWESGDILGYKYEDGKKVNVSGDKDSKGNDVFDEKDYVPVWKYNTLLKKYYKDKLGKEGEYLGVDYMTEEEFEKYYESTVIEVEKSFKGFTAIDSITTTAYASLDLYNVDEDEYAERALYEDYKFGKFTATTTKCSSCGKTYNTWTFDGNVFWPEKTCDHKGKEFFVEGYTPVVDEDGKYVDGYVIYNYDAETGAIKVVKNIDGSDEDSYVATGVVRAYNVAKETITIGEDKLDMNYDELNGTEFLKVNDSAANKAKYSAILNDCFNQFVKYVVVDGELVHIELAGAASNELIVVDSYAGLSSDGYIVIKGYSTEDVKFESFRLGSIDGWKSGDAYYYLDEDNFVGKGDVYKVVSYDEDEDVYFVELISNDRQFVDAYADNYVKFSADGKDNYMTKDSKWDNKDKKFTKSEFVKMSGDDRYIIVGNYDTKLASRQYAKVVVYAGKLPAGAEIYGDLVKADNGTYVLVNAEVKGLDISAYETGLVVLFEDSRYEVANYNGEGAEDWYLLGAVEYTVRAFDLLTGKDDLTVYATNKNYDEGYAYYTQGGVLTAEGENEFFTANDIVTAVNDAFAKEKFFAKKIPFASLAALYDTTANDDGIAKNRVAVEALLLADGNKIDGSSKALNKLDEIIYKVIEIDETSNRYNTKKFIGDINSDVTADKGGKSFAKLIEDGNYTNLDAFYIYNVAEKDVVIYIVLNDDVNEVTTTASATISNDWKTGIDTKKAEAIVVDSSSVYADLDVVATVDVIKELKNDKMTGKVAVSAMTFATAGESLKTLTDHQAEGFDYHFGKVTTKDGKTTWNNVFAAADCVAEGVTASAFVTIIAEDGSEAYKDYATVTWVSTYDDNCDLVNKIKVALNKTAYFTGSANVKVELDLVDGFGTAEYNLLVDVCDAYENFELVGEYGKANVLVQAN